LTGLTPTQRDVLRLIAEGHELGDYVPRYRPGAQRGRGAFPATIAARAAAQLERMGLVEREPATGRYALTGAGTAELGGAVREDPHAARFQGVGRIAGRKLAYIEWPDGRMAWRSIPAVFLTQRPIDYAS